MTDKEFATILLARLDEANQKIGKLEAAAQATRQNRDRKVQDALDSALDMKLDKLALVRLVRDIHGAGLGDAKTIAERSKLWKAIIEAG